MCSSSWCCLASVPRNCTVGVHPVLSTHPRLRSLHSLRLLNAKSCRFARWRSRASKRPNRKPNMPATVSREANPARGITGEQRVESSHQLTFYSEATMATMSGTIKRLTDKGFGFIAASDGTEYFFHQSACSDARFDELREGQSVTFERGQGPKGPRAENVRVTQ